MVKSFSPISKKNRLGQFRKISDGKVVNLLLDRKTASSFDEFLNNIRGSDVSLLFCRLMVSTLSKFWNVPAGIDFKRLSFRCMSRKASSPRNAAASRFTTLL